MNWLHSSLFFSSHVWEPADWEEGYIHDTSLIIIASLSSCQSICVDIISLVIGQLSHFEWVWSCLLKGTHLYKTCIYFIYIIRSQAHHKAWPPNSWLIVLPKFPIHHCCCLLFSFCHNQMKKNATFQHSLWSSAFGVYKSGMQRRNHLRLDSYF